MSKADEFISLCVEAARYAQENLKIIGCYNCPVYGTCMAIPMENIPDQLCDIGRVYSAWEDLP